MEKLEHMHLPGEKTVVAPDGSDVRVLLGLEGGGMAHFQLSPGMTSRATAHQTVEEIGYILTGTGKMWRKLGEQETTVDLEPGLCLTIPVGTHFQFRCEEDLDLEVVAVTMPPWPGEEEAFEVEGKW